MLCQLRGTTLAVAGLLLLLLAACDTTGAGSAAPTAVIAVPTTAATNTVATTAPAGDLPTAAPADNAAAPTAPATGGRKKHVTGAVDGSLKQAGDRYMFDVSTVHFVYDQTPKAGHEAAVYTIHAEGDLDRSIPGADKLRFTVTNRKQVGENGDWLVIGNKNKDAVAYQRVGSTWQVVNDALGPGNTVPLNLGLPSTVASPMYGEEANLSTVSSNETVAGQDCIHYHHFHGATGTPERTDTDVWVSKANGLYARIQTVRKDDTVTWDYSNYDAPVSIAAPAP